MTIPLDHLDDLLNGGHNAARVLDARGWTQGTLEALDGRVCAEGAALRACTIPGDGHLLRQVMLSHWQVGASFNDAPGRTATEVRAALDRDVTEDDLAATFGPQWRAVVTLVRRAAALAPAEATALRAAWVAAWDAAMVAAWDAARVAAWDAAMGAARDAARAAAWDAARVAAWDAARVTAWDAAMGAARDAARALVVRDLIGQHGFTADHYRTLTRPWAQVIGPVHPDDEKDGLL